MIDYARLFKLLFWLALLGAYGLAVSPSGETPGLGWDKANHMLAFFTLAVFMRPAWRSASSLLLGGVLALFGGLIEITQMVPALHRDASWADWFADLAAIAAGLVVANLALRIRDRWSGKRRSA
jgi:hypothetical protein